MEYNSPNVVKVVVNKLGFAMYFSRSPIPYIKTNTNRENICLYRHVGLYVYKKKALLEFASMRSTALEMCEGLEQLRFLENGYKMKVVETHYKSIGVDTPQDLERVKNIMLNR